MNETVVFQSSLTQVVLLNYQQMQLIKVLKVPFLDRILLQVMGMVL